jgi:uncharacterized protein (TIGR02246 family)
MTTMTADGQAIRGMIAAWARASEAGDLATIDALMDSEVLFLTPGNEPMDRDTFRERFESVVMKVHLECHPEVHEVEVSGDWAYAWSWLEIRITPPDGATIERKGNVLSVFRRRPGGRWKLWRDANLIVD